MSDTVFHIVEHNPYRPQPFVLTEVAICLREAIRAAGFPCEHVHGIDPAAFSIVLGGTPAMQAEWPLMDPRRCAIFNFEQLGSDSPLAGPAYRRWLADWLVLDYHRDNIEVLRAENGPRQQAIELPIVPCEALQVPGAADPQVDVLFYGTMNERRAAVIAQLRAAGRVVEVVAGAYGSELAPALHRAKLVLHVHFYVQGLFPVARILQPVVLGVPVVCETSVFSPLNDWSASGILFADGPQLASACLALLDAPQERTRRAQQARAFAATIDFATPFAQVASAMASRSAGTQAGPAHAIQGEAEGLSDAQIEALLEAETQAPAPDHDPGRPVELVRNEPGRTRLSRWLVWVMVFFVLIGLVKVIRGYW